MRRRFQRDLPSLRSILILSAKARNDPDARDILHDAPIERYGREYSWAPETANNHGYLNPDEVRRGRVRYFVILERERLKQYEALRQPPGTPTPWGLARGKYAQAPFYVASVYSSENDPAFRKLGGLAPIITFTYPHSRTTTQSWMNERGLARTSKWKSSR